MEEEKHIIIVGNKQTSNLRKLMELAKKSSDDIIILGDPVNYNILDDHIIELGKKLAQEYERKINVSEKDIKNILKKRK